MDNSYEPLIFFLGVVIFILLRIATYPLLPSDYYTNDNLSELPNSFAKYVNDHPPQDSIALTNYIIKSSKDVGLSNKHLQQVMFIMQGWYLYEQHYAVTNGTFIKKSFGPVNQKSWNYCSKIIKSANKNTITYSMIEDCYKQYASNYSSLLMLKIYDYYGIDKSERFDQMIHKLICTPEDKLADLICAQPFWKKDTTSSTLTKDDSYACYVAYMKSDLYHTIDS